MHSYSTIFVLLAIFLQAQSHMLLWKPWRFNATGDNSPLVGPGEGISNYPCKVMGNYDFDFDRTQIPLGSQYTVVFEGESVHGGGSCQFSLSTDLEPHAQSEFKVIHSIEGGCPARNTPGNLGDDDSSTTLDPFLYNFTMPNDIPTGKYTFAWSWFNKVGNREMYMNCAPIEVTSGSKRRDLQSRASSVFDSLPDLFLANIPDVSCTTAVWPGDMTFPDPGSSVDQNVPAGQRSAPVMNGATVDQCKAPVKAQAASPSGTPTPSTGGYGSYGSSGSYSSGGTGSGSYGSGSSGSYASVSPVAPLASSTPTSSNSPPFPINSSAPITNSASGSGSCGSGKVSCTSIGGVVCIGSSEFGICDLDNCAVAQPLAAGTSCSGGTITKRALRIPPQARPNRVYQNGHRALWSLFI